MNDTKAVKWLFEQLPDLIEHNIITPDTAARIKAHYAHTTDGAARNRTNLMITLFSIIGSLSIGLGIILLFAHNWDQLVRWQRTALAFLPTVITLSLICWVVGRDKKSVGLREGLGILNMLAVGATIALVGQIYQIPGSIRTFLLTWMLVTVPVVYILSASAPVLLYLICITTWTCLWPNRLNEPLLFWPLLLIIVPHVRMQIMHNTRMAQWILFVLCITCAVAIGASVGNHPPWILLFSLYPACAYLIGIYVREKTGRRWAVPLQYIGCAGSVAMAYVLTFHGVWDQALWSQFNSSVMTYGYATILTLLFIVLSMHQHRHAKRLELLVGVMPLVSLIGFSLAAGAGYLDAAAWLFSGYLVILGVSTIMHGIRVRRFMSANGGIIIVLAVMSARFLETDVSILARAFVFLLMGIAFLLVNIRLADRLRGGKHEG